MIYSSRNSRDVARYAGPADSGRKEVDPFLADANPDTGAPNCILKIPKRFLKTATGIKVSPSPAPPAILLFYACDLV